MAESGGSSAGGDANTSFSLVGDYGCSDSDSADESHDFTVLDSHDVELSEMVLKNNIINACAHGPLPDKPSDSDEGGQIIIDSVSNGVIEYSISDYREQDSDDSVSSDSSSDINSVKDAEEVDSSEEDSLEREGEGEAGKRAPVRARGELTMDDLPPIEELSISVPAAQTSPVGVVHNIIDKLVIVRAFPNTPAVDLDSVLFLDKGERALGKVFDVFGPVSEPHYCVRFNSAEHIQERDVRVGAEVFIAPDTDHTSFVFVSQLIKMKGSDASWLNDVEPPASQLDFSDDEEERQARRERRGEHAANARASQQTDRAEGQANRRSQQRPERGHPSPRPANPFGALRRPPRPAWPPAWRELDPARPPPFVLARPMFAYPPPGFGLPMRPQFARPFYMPPPRGFHNPWFAEAPRRPPNT